MYVSDNDWSEKKFKGRKEGMAETDREYFNLDISVGNQSVKMTSDTWMYFCNRGGNGVPEEGNYIGKVKK